MLITAGKAPFLISNFTCQITGDLSANKRTGTTLRISIRVAHFTKKQEHGTLKIKSGQTSSFTSVKNIDCCAKELNFCRATSCTLFKSLSETERNLFKEDRNIWRRRDWENSSCAENSRSHKIRVWYGESSAKWAEYKEQLHPCASIRNASSLRYVFRNSSWGLLENI